SQHLPAARAETRRCPAARRLGGSDAVTAGSHVAHRAAALRGRRQATAARRLDRLFLRGSEPRGRRRRVARLLRRFAGLPDRARQYRGSRAFLDPGQAAADSPGQFPMIAAVRENPWLRHGAFILANLAAAFIALELVVFPIRTFLADRDAEIAQQQQLLARLSAMAAQGPAVQKLFEQGASTKDRPEFLSGPNQGVIIANLQSRLSGMVQSAGGHVRSVRSLPPKVVDGLTLVGAQVELSGPLRAVQQTVYAIESSMPYLFIMGATIKPSMQANFRGVTNTAAAPTLEA